MLAFAGNALSLAHLPPTLHRVDSGLAQMQESLLLLTRWRDCQGKLALLLTFELCAALNRMQRVVYDSESCRHVESSSLKPDV